MKTNKHAIEITNEVEYVYDIYFADGSHRTERNRKYQCPLRIGEELTVWWTSNTYVIERIIHWEDRTVVVVISTEKTDTEFRI